MDPAADLRPVDIALQEDLVPALRQFMVRHPDLDGLCLTAISRTIDPQALGTLIVGAQGPIATPDLWLLAGLRLAEGSQAAIERAKAPLLGLLKMYRNLTQDVERQNHAKTTEAGSAPGDVQPDVPD